MSFILEWFKLFKSIKTMKSHIATVIAAMEKEDFDQEATKKRLDIIQKDMITLEKNLREFDKLIN